MTLDPDCVRDILLNIEAAPFGKRIDLSTLKKELPSYPEENIWYTCVKLKEGGYLDVSTSPALRSPLPVILKINGLTFNGHEFLNEIRQSSNWGKIKSVASTAGVNSLKALADISKEVAKAAILSTLQLPR